MESWRKVWREGIAPQLSTKALEELLYGLEKDSDMLIQGRACSPDPIEPNYDKPLHGCCAITYGAWIANEISTVNDADGYISQVFHEAEKRIGDWKKVVEFFHWFDGTSRDEMRREMIKEVDNELTIRSGILGLPVAAR